MSCLKYILYKSTPIYIKIPDFKNLYLYNYLLINLKF